VPPSPALQILTGSVGAWGIGPQDWPAEHSAAVVQSWSGPIAVDGQGPA